MRTSETRASDAVDRGERWLGHHEREAMGRIDFTATNHGSRRRVPVCSEFNMISSRFTLPLLSVSSFIYILRESFAKDERKSGPTWGKEKGGEKRRSRASRETTRTKHRFQAKSKDRERGLFPFVFSQQYKYPVFTSGKYTPRSPTTSFPASDTFDLRPWCRGCPSTSRGSQGVIDAGITVELVPRLTMNACGYKHGYGYHLRRTEISSCPPKK